MEWVCLYLVIFLLFTLDYTVVVVSFSMKAMHNRVAQGNLSTVEGGIVYFKGHKLNINDGPPYLSFCTWFVLHCQLLIMYAGHERCPVPQWSYFTMNLRRCDVKPIATPEKWGQVVKRPHHYVCKIQIFLCCVPYSFRHLNSFCYFTNLFLYKINPQNLESFLSCIINHCQHHGLSAEWQILMWWLSTEIKSVSIMCSEYHTSWRWI